MHLTAHPFNPIRAVERYRRTNVEHFVQKISTLSKATFSALTTHQRAIIRVHVLT